MRRFVIGCSIVVISLYGFFSGMSSPNLEGMRDFPNRREGTAIQLHASEDLSLLAIHRNFEQFQRNASLNVHFFVPKLSSPELRTSLFVQASELTDLNHYLMKSKPSGSWQDNSWNVFEPWPTKDVIDVLQLSSSNIGVVACYTPPGELPVYLPVDVDATNVPASHNPYTFYVLTAQDLQSLDINVTDGHGAAVKIAVPALKCNKAAHPNCTLYAAGSTQAFDLDFSKQPAGEYQVHLVGHIPRTTDTTSLNIRLYAHP